MKKLNLGIIGAGWPGQMHAQAIGLSRLANLYACADLDDARRAAFAKRIRAEKAYGDYHELLQDRHVDAVIICLPNFLHFPASLAALEAGKHVLCEKPPTMNAAEMKVLREEATKRNLVYFFSRQFRFTPAMRAAKKVIEEGRLGKIYHAKATFVRSRGIPVGIGNWFTEKKRSGGGALIDIGIHALDAVWYLMGTPRPIAVSAQVFRNFEHLVKVPVFDVEDAAYAFHPVRQRRSGAIGNFVGGKPAGRYSSEKIFWTRVEQLGFFTEQKRRCGLKPLTLFEDRDGELVTVPLEAAEDEPNGFRAATAQFFGSDQWARPKR